MPADSGVPDADAAAEASTGPGDASDADASTVWDPSDGLILHYRFNESTGEVAHDYAGEEDGLIVGSTQWVSAGRIGGALRLAGGFPEPDAGASGSYVELPQGVLVKLDECTIATWFNWNGTNSWERVFDFGNDLPVWIYFTPRGATGFPALGGRRPDPLGIFVDAVPIAGAPSGQGELVIDELIRSSTWTHLAVTWHPERIAVYLDGELKGEAVPVGAVSPKQLGNTTRNWIGRSQFPDSDFGGMIDDFRIYNRALKSGEVAQLYVLE